MEPLLIVLFLAMVGERLTEALARPIFERAGWDTFWLRYVAWVVCSLLVFASGANLFAAYIGNVLLGQLLTSLVAGGGSNFLHDLWPQQAVPRATKFYDD